MTVLWSRYLQCLYFFRGGVSRGQGTKSQEIFPSPVAQSFLINGHKHCVFGRRTSLVPATPGCEIWGAKNMTRTLEISVWDLRYRGNLTGLKGRVCLCGRCDFRTNASHVWRRTSALHTMVLGAR